MQHSPLNIQPLSESALVITFGHIIGIDVLVRITSFNQLLQTHPFSGFITTVPAYTTLSIFYHPLQVLNNKDLTGKNCFEKVTNYLLNLYKNEHTPIANATRLVPIPTCYGSVHGPDIETVARRNKLSVNEVIYLHSNGVYTVYMIGFVPGFAYLGGLDEKLFTPRKTTPAKVVPAGSVGIGGQQTGIYSLDTPGGWQIIGCTPLCMFDMHRSQPSLLKAGDQVKFSPVTPEEYEYLNRQYHADTN